MNGDSKRAGREKNRPGGLRGRGKRGVFSCQKLANLVP